MPHVPGRTGDDCLAFERNDNGDIVRVMICESKCTADHNATLINDAHEKVSSSNVLPVDLARIIEALLLIPDEDSTTQWVNALRRLYFSKDPNKERCDLVMYVCGRKPKIKETWIDASEPHESYKGKRKLTAVELHLSDVAIMLKSIYSNI